jgi:hypothetical protein
MQTLAETEADDELPANENADSKSDDDDSGVLQGTRNPKSQSQEHYKEHDKRHYDYISHFPAISGQSVYRFRNLPSWFDVNDEQLWPRSGAN